MAPSAEEKKKPYGMSIRVDEDLLVGLTGEQFRLLEEKRQRVTYSELIQKAWDFYKRFRSIHPEEESLTDDELMVEIKLNRSDLAALEKAAHDRGLRVDSYIGDVLHREAAADFSLQVDKLTEKELANLNLLLEISRRPNPKSTLESLVNGTLDVIRDMRKKATNRL